MSDLRDQINAALRDAVHHCVDDACTCDPSTAIYPGCGADDDVVSIEAPVESIADAVMPVVEKLTQRAEKLEAAIAEVRRLQDMTIAVSCRAYAIEQAEDTLAVLDRTLGPPKAPSERCPSCDHLLSMHQADGCWHTVTIGRRDRDMVCPCAALQPVPVTDADVHTATAPQSGWAAEPRRLTEQQGGIPNDAMTAADMAAARKPRETP